MIHFLKNFLKYLNFQYYFDLNALNNCVYTLDIYSEIYLKKKKHHKWIDELKTNKHFFSPRKKIGQNPKAPLTKKFIYMYHAVLITLIYIPDKYDIFIYLRKKKYIK